MCQVVISVHADWTIETTHLAHATIYNFLRPLGSPSPTYLIQSMDLSSPIKRRVLGALDPNASSPKPHQGLKQKQQQQSTKGGPPRGSSATHQDISHLACPSTTPEPSLLASEGDAKRPVSTMAPHADESGEPARKRPCLGDAADVSVDHDDRQRSVSPDTSSVFDYSAIDTSQATTVTEPDTEQTGPVPSLEGRAQNRPMPIPPRPQPMQQRSLEEVRQVCPTPRPGKM